MIRQAIATAAGVFIGLVAFALLMSMVATMRQQQAVIDDVCARGGGCDHSH